MFSCYIPYLLSISKKKNLISISLKVHLIENILLLFNKAHPANDIYQHEIENSIF